MANPKRNKRTTSGKKAPALKAGGWLAVIRIRGAPKMSSESERTLHHLHLPRRNSCSILAHTPSNLGMIQKVQNYITWGEVTDDTIKQLDSKASKRGERAFSLASPKKGLERKGIKLPSTAGGSLGHRKDINKLILRMI